MPTIPALRRVRQETLKFKDSLSYITRPCPKTHKKKRRMERTELVASHNGSHSRIIIFKVVICSLTSDCQTTTTDILC